MQVIKLGMIGTNSAAVVESELAKLDPSETLYLDIHSEGGAVFEGFAIYNMLAEWSGKVVARIKAAAFSIASYIAMAADEIEIADNGYMMIHNPWTETLGDDTEHQKNAKLLSELKQSMINAYSKKTGLDAVLIKELMKEETYLGAERAIELGMADRIVEPIAVQPQSKIKLPQVVYATLYGERVGGDEKPEHKEIPMPEKIVATVKQIKARYPKASNKFIVRCMEEEMDAEEVQEARSEELEEDNSTLESKLAELETEMEAMRAVISNLKGEEMEEEPVAEEDKEELPAAKKRSTGTRAMEVASQPSQTGDPHAEWEKVIQSFLAQSKTRKQAVSLANKRHPELRLALVEAKNLR